MAVESKTGNPILITAAETHICKQKSMHFGNIMWHCTADGTLVLAKDSSSAEASNIITVPGSGNQTYDVFNGVDKTFSNLYVRTMGSGVLYCHRK
jgi:hypothetical protein